MLGPGEGEVAKARAPAWGGLGVEDSGLGPSIRKLSYPLIPKMGLDNWNLLE